VNSKISEDHDLQIGAMKSWEERQLHAWLTVATLYGEGRPKKAKEPVPLNRDQRKAQICRLLGFSETGSREVVDALDSSLAIDDGIVQKMLDDRYIGRIPYLHLVPLAPSRAVEIWRLVTKSQATQTESIRDYYLVPIQDDPDNDGYVVIAESGRIFNFLLFRASYADKSLRREGVLLYKAYADGVTCTSGCCTSLAKTRHEIGVLRDENRRLKLQLRDERKARKAAELHLSRKEAP
jgi:hypothetical protein